ncbi:hypothetical protein GGI16_003094 [Coemansia sp. S142-1]|nr:hypothetical protein GGI16_003094 [Coemansia sp. S142-1]
MVDDIVVHPCYVSDDLHPTAGDLFGYLIAQLNQLASRVKYTSFSNVPMLLHSGSIDGLVHFTYEERNSTDSTHGLLMQLVRRSAPTLQLLDITLARVSDMTGLIQDCGCDYTEYPCLKTLKLSVWYYMDKSPLSVADGVVLFPVLRQLSILGDYPFGDDILFRGNSTMLKYLSIMPTHETCLVLCEHKVFTPTSHPNLQCVKVKHLSGDMDYDFDSSDFSDFSDSFVKCLQFAHGIAPEASMRTIARLGDSFEETAICVLTVASTCPNFNHVALPKSEHSEFMMVLEETIEIDRFKQDSPRLRRLLFNR